MFETPDREVVPLALMETQDNINRLNYPGYNGIDNESSDESESISGGKGKTDEYGDTPKKEIKEETKEQPKPEKKINLFEGLNCSGFDFGFDEPEEPPQEEKKTETLKLDPPKPQENEIILLEGKPVDFPLEINSNSNGEASKGADSIKSEPEKIVTLPTINPPPVPETAQNKPPEVPRIQDNRPPPPGVTNFPPPYGYNPGYPQMPYHPYNRMPPMMPPGSMGMNNMNPYYGYNYQQPMWSGGYQQKPMPG